jgi:hypothetical protein
MFLNSPAWLWLDQDSTTLVPVQEVEINASKEMNRMCLKATIVASLHQFVTS